MSWNSACCWTPEIKNASWDCFLFQKLWKLKLNFWSDKSFPTFPKNILPGVYAPFHQNFWTCWNGSHFGSIPVFSAANFSIIFPHFETSGSFGWIRMQSTDESMGIFFNILTSLVLFPGYVHSIWTNGKFWKFRRLYWEYFLFVVIPCSYSFLFLLLTRFLQLKSWESRKLSKFWSIVTCTAKFAVSGMQNYDLICYAQKNVNYFSLKIIDKYNK